MSRPASHDATSSDATSDDATSGGSQAEADGGIRPQKDPSSTNQASLESLIRSKSVIVCLGPGGVGKTTTAASVAIAGAKLGLRVAVLTVDPARRLADAMGLGHSPANNGTDGPEHPNHPDQDPPNNPTPTNSSISSGPNSDRSLGPDDDTTSDDTTPDHKSRLGDRSGLDNEARQIAGPWDGELWGVMLDPKATFDQLIHEHAETDKQRDAILNNRLYQNLTTTLTGTNEYMAAERLRALHADDRFDLVVLDTPPAHHAIDLLDSPGRLSRFVDHPIYRTILAPKPGVFRAMTSAANLVVRAIGQVVGSTLLADAIAFFNDFAGMDQGFRDRAAEVDQLLQSLDTSYVLISSPRHEPLQAGQWIVDQLAERDRTVDAVILNRMTPRFWPPEDAKRWQGSDDPLVKNLLEMINLRRTEEQLVAEAVSGFGASASDPTSRHSDQSRVADAEGLVRILIDEQPTPISDLEALSLLSESLI